MKAILLTLFVVVISSQYIECQQMIEKKQLEYDDYSNCQWYCDRIKAWRVYEKEFKKTYYTKSPISPKWIDFYSDLLAKC